MRFFREAAPNIFVGIGRLETEQDGRDWIGDYERCLAAGVPIAIIASIDDRPLPAAGKPMVLWLKARRVELGRLVKLTIYVAQDETERAELIRSLPGRAKSAPYAMAVAASETEAIAMARERLR